MSNALSKIRESGFQIALDGSDLVVSPFSKLTPPQVQFLKSHKAEIIQALQQEQAANENHGIVITVDGNAFFADDRHYCRECRHLNYQGRCTASPTRYHPVDIVPRRCADFSA